tara:strand:+ start:328 stop:1128 length:801 start_codon:yes stop_codon:yes gene_type:complete
MNKNFLTIRKYLLFYSVLFFLVGCSPSEEELKLKSDEIYNEIRSIPASDPCSNLEGYRKLQSFESRFDTNFYGDLSDKKIKEYDEKCTIKLKEKEELRKLGNWSIGRYVDEFGDYTGNGYVQLTVKGYFSNSATTDSRLRVEMMLSNASYEKKPWFKFYEYDGNNPLKGVFQDSNPILCKVKDENSEIFSIGLYQGQGWDYLAIDDYEEKINDVDKLRMLIVNEGVAKFSCHQKRYSSDKYKFVLNFKYFSNAVRKYELTDAQNSE